MYILIFALGTLDRSREICTFQSWLEKLADKFGLDKDGNIYKWLRSKDEDELKQWYWYPVRDGYHAFKNIAVGLICIYIASSFLDFCLLVVCWYVSQKLTYYAGCK